MVIAKGSNVRSRLVSPSQHLLPSLFARPHAPTFQFHDIPFIWTILVPLIRPVLLNLPFSSLDVDSNIVYAACTPHADHVARQGFQNVVVEQVLPFLQIECPFTSARAWRLKPRD